MSEVSTQKKNVASTERKKTKTYQQWKLQQIEYSYI